jgi:hypothetical protein
VALRARSHISKSDCHFEECIDPSLLTLNAFSPSPTERTVTPTDLRLQTTKNSTRPTHRYDPMSYETGSANLVKRQTLLRRTLRECSTDSRLNVLPSVPKDIVDKFWVVYNIIHDLSRDSPPEPRLFRGFYEYDGQGNRCLLCNYKIQNQTQMVQHIEGLHFDSFQHRCSVKGW